MKAEDYTNKLRSGELTPDDICPVMYAMSLIGQKWKINILWHLADEGHVHYNALKRGLPGITNVVLTKCLTELADHGLVLRDQQHDIPPVVVYSLTERGKTLIPILYDIHRWGKDQMMLDCPDA